VPKLTSYEVAPSALHERLALIATPVSPLEGVGEVGAEGGCAELPAVTLTLSKTDAFNAEVSWLVTARPTTTALLIQTIWLPTTCQSDPSADTEAVNVSPFRVSFTQAGGACVDVPPTIVAVPHVVLARNSIAPDGTRSTTAFGAPEPTDSRIITPALAHVFVFCMRTTRAMISPSPSSG
jgi:hypothetical protein